MIECIRTKEIYTLYIPLDPIKGEFYLENFNCRKNMRQLIKLKGRVAVTLTHLRSISIYHPCILEFLGACSQRS